MYILNNGSLEKQGKAESFTLKPIPAINQQSDFEAIAAFNKNTMELYRQVSIESSKLNTVSNKIPFMEAALMQMTSAEPSLFSDLKAIEEELRDLQIALRGDGTRGSKDEASSPSVMSRVWQAQNWGNTQAPTQTNKASFKLAQTGLESYRDLSSKFFEQVQAYEAKLSAAGAPYTPGRIE
jgi:hypothetical protein